MQHKKKERISHKGPGRRGKANKQHKSHKKSRGTKTNTPLAEARMMMMMKGTTTNVCALVFGKLTYHFSLWVGKRVGSSGTEDGA